MTTVVAGVLAKRWCEEWWWGGGGSGGYGGVRGGVSVCNDLVN